MEQKQQINNSKEEISGEILLDCEKRTTFKQNLKNSLKSLPVIKFLKRIKQTIKKYGNLHPKVAQKQQKSGVWLKNCNLQFVSIL